MARARSGGRVVSVLHPTDQQLVRSLRKGDDAAFTTIYDRYRDELVRHAARMLGDARAVAEDVVQDAFLRAHGALRANDNDVALRAWLHRVVRNAAIDEIRRNGTRRTVAGDLEHIERTRGSADAAELAQMARDVLADIARLPERQRTVLVQHAIHGVPHAELAEELDISVTASKGLLFRARTGLARAA
jgi:RNA polymerase sigma factor (sigma-70 family)